MLKLKMGQARTDFEKYVCSQLRETDLFKGYERAFVNATGLPLMLVEADYEGECVSPGATNHGPFCETLHICTDACRACIETNRRLLNEASIRGPVSCRCFAGLTASSVPVMNGKSILGYLKTGQVFTRVPDKVQFDRVLRKIGKKNLNPELVELLRASYFKTRLVDPSRYASMIALLETFAVQLGHYAESLSLIESGKEPCSIAKARNFVQNHLGEGLTLGLVAKAVGLSDSHFCRLFRETTGLTLTDYVNRCRIDRAKSELLKQKKRISEIAYEVGYQSLSQFNRNFLRLNGIAPTAWRRLQIASTAVRPMCP